MDDFTSSSPIAQSEKVIHAICSQAIAIQSDVSISSTATASDLSGSGRTLGKLYGFIGRRLVVCLNKLAERHGYGPQAIESRVLTLVEEFPHSRTNGDKKLKKDLTRLIQYVESHVESNQVLACRAIVSIALASPYIQELLRDLGAIRALALVHAQEAESIRLTDILLSSSRKALIILVGTEITAIGRKWVLLSMQFRDATKYDGNDKKLKRVNHLDEQYYDAHSSCYQEIVKYVRSGSPGQSWLALRFFAEQMRRRVRDDKQECRKTIPNRDVSSSSDSSQMRSLRQLQMQRNHQLHVELARSIHRYIMRSPHSVDWSSIEFALLQLRVQDIVMSASGVVKSCACSDFVDDIITRFSSNFSPDIAPRIRNINILKRTLRQQGNPLNAMNEILSGTWVA